MRFASPMQAHAIRLLPGDDLVTSIQDYCAANKLSASAVISCVGSLSECTLRLAGANEIVTLVEELEIVSLVGTACADGEHHLHCSMAKCDGSVVGGHCKGAFTIRTTAEIVIAELPGISFSRGFDAATGYKELHIAHADSSTSFSSPDAAVEG